MSHDLTLFGVGTSRTMRAHWMLLELGLDYESHPIQSCSGETLTDEFKPLNLRPKIPVLQHGKFVLKLVPFSTAFALSSAVTRLPHFRPVVRFSNEQAVDFVLRGKAKGTLQRAALWSGALAVEVDE